LAIDATGAVYLSTYDRGGMDPSGIMGFEPDGAVRMSLTGQPADLPTNGSDQLVFGSWPGGHSRT